MRDELAAFAFIAFLTFFGATEVSSPGEDDQPRIEIPAVKADESSKPIVMLASWYGYPFDGRLTASGEKFEMFRISVAHKSLEFGTELLLTNPENGRQTTAVVNDRGPFIVGRDLDLSFGAALELGFAHQGLARLIVEIVKKPSQKHNPI